jgi:hypothetical protein
MIDHDDPRYADVEYDTHAYERDDSDDDQQRDFGRDFGMHDRATLRDRTVYAPPGKRGE